MKKALLFLTIFVLFAIVGIVSLPYVLDINEYKEQLRTIIKEKTGADIKISGKIELDVFPNIALVLNDVSVDEGRFLTIDKLVVDLKIMPLFQGRADISSLDIISPSVNFLVSKTGEKKWEFSKADSAKENKESSDIKGSDNSGTDFISLKYISISNASILYKNDQNHTELSVKGLSIKTSFLDGDNPFKIKGNFKFNQSENEEFSFSGSYSVSGKKYVAKDINFKLGKESGHAEFSSDFSNIIPEIDLAFNISALNLNKYLLPDNNISDENLSESKSAKEDISFSWSDENFNFDNIRNYNLNLSVKTGMVNFNEFYIDNMLINIHTLNGKLIFNIKELSLYEGNVISNFVLDTTTQTPYLSLDNKIQNVNFTKIKDSVSFFSYFDGIFNSNLKISSQGNSQLEVMRKLSGNGDLSFSSGKIKGLDLFSMVGNITDAFNFKKNKSSVTDFASLAGTFNIEDGILDNQDMLLKSKIVDFEGKGQADLSKLRLKYKVIPKIKSESYEENRINIKVPILIEGSLMRPIFRPDLVNPLKQLIRDPEATGNLIKQIKKDFKGLKSLKGFGKNLGGSEKENNSESEIQIPSEIKDILNAF